PRQRCDRLRHRLSANRSLVRLRWPPTPSQMQKQRVKVLYALSFLLRMGQKARLVLLSVMHVPEMQGARHMAPPPAIGLLSSRSRVSRQDSKQVKDDSKRAASGERRKHPDLELENRNRSHDCKSKSPRIDAGKSWCIERQQESLHRNDFAKDAVECKPDR